MVTLKTCALRDLFHSVLSLSGNRAEQRHEVGRDAVEKTHFQLRVLARLEVPTYAEPWQNSRRDH